MKLGSNRPQQKLGDADGHTTLRMRLAAADPKLGVHLVVVVPGCVAVARLVLVADIVAGIGFVVLPQRLQHSLGFSISFCLEK